MNVINPTVNLEISDGYGTISSAAAVEYSGPMESRATKFNDHFDSDGNDVRSGGSGSQIRILDKLAIFNFLKVAFRHLWSYYKVFVLGDMTSYRLGCHFSKTIKIPDI